MFVAHYFVISFKRILFKFISEVTYVITKPQNFWEILNIKTVTDVGIRYYSYFLVSKLFGINLNLLTKLIAIFTYLFIFFHRGKFSCLICSLKGNTKGTTLTFLVFYNLICLPFLSSSVCNLSSLCLEWTVSQNTEYWKGHRNRIYCICFLGHTTQ